MITTLIVTAFSALAASYLPAKVCLRNTTEEIRIYRDHKRTLGRELGTVDEAHVYLATSIPLPPVQQLGTVEPPCVAITQQQLGGEEDTPVDSLCEPLTVPVSETSELPCVSLIESTEDTSVATTEHCPVVDSTPQEGSTYRNQEPSPTPVSIVRCVTDGELRELRPVQLQNLEMCVALPIDRRNNVVKPNRHKQFGMSVYLLAKERFGLPAETAANRLAVRKFVSDKLRAHGLRPSHAHMHIDRITNRVFIPNREEILCAYERRSWSARFQRLKYACGLFGAFRPRSDDPY